GRADRVGGAGGRRGRDGQAIENRRRSDRDGRGSLGSGRILGGDQNGGIRKNVGGQQHDRAVGHRRAEGQDCRVARYDEIRRNAADDGQGRRRVRKNGRGRRQDGGGACGGRRLRKRIVRGAAARC